MTSVFGIVLEIPAKQGILIFLLVLLLLIVLEYLFKYIDKLSERHGYEGINEKLKKELTVLGIISFLVFIYEAIANNSSDSYFEAFEFAHIVVLFMAIAFIIQALRLVRFAVSGGKDILAATRSSFDELEKNYNDLEGKKTSWSRWAFHNLPSWLPTFPKFRRYIEYRIIEKFFVEQHPVPKGFKFSKYAAVLFKKYIAELGEVTPFSWMLIALLAVLNFMRVALIDPDLKSGICQESADDDHSNESYLSSSESSSEHESFSTGCVDYILPYAAFGVGALFVFTVVIYFASSIYYDRVIYNCLKWDGIKVEEKNGKEAYKDFLENSKFHELKYKELTQQSLLEFTGTRIGIQKRKTVTTPQNETSHSNQSVETRQASPLASGTNALVTPSNAIKPKESTPPDWKGNKRQSYPLDQSRKASVYGLTDMYSNDPETMTIDDYKLELDYMKAKVEHEEEILLSKPWYERWYHQMVNMEKSKLPESAIAKPKKDTAETKANQQDIELVSTEQQTKRDSLVNVKPTQKERIIAHLFLFQSPAFHFALVNMSLLFECFYISIWATQLIPLTMHSNDKVFYVIFLTIPIVISGYLFESILHQTVMLQCVEGLHIEVVDFVCDECIQETKVLLNIRRAIREKCIEKSSDRSKWHTIIRDQFNKFDEDENGFLDSTEFRKFLGTLDIFISKARFDVAWEAIDFDLSGAITWDELFVLVFPEFQYDIREEVKLFEDLREQMLNKLQTENVPKQKWRSYLEKLFEEVDEDKSSFIEKGELVRLLTLLNFRPYSESEVHMLFHAMDNDCDDKISFHDLCRVLQLNLKKSADVPDDDPRSSSFSFESAFSRLSGTLGFNKRTHSSKKDGVDVPNPLNDPSRDAARHVLNSPSENVYNV